MEDGRCALNELHHQKGKDNVKMASYIYGLIGKKEKNDLEGLTWRKKRAMNNSCSIY